MARFTVKDENDKSFRKYFSNLSDKSTATATATATISP